MDPAMNINAGRRKFGLAEIKKYVKLDSGRLHNTPFVRNVSMGVQGGGLLIFTLFALLYRWMLNTTGFFFLVNLIWEIVSWVGMIYFTVALFLSVRDNLPKMVSTKNSVGLFVFTLLFFEFGIMCVLFWFLYFALSIAGTPMCRSDFCSGTISGFFIYVNIIAVICIAVVVRARKNLGIGFLDAFNIN
eukprot:TRINITY_DN12523_c0_g1_i1.p1 TRINITY_DN12523_c0_g1~~TRINITY_DN12523_c0_g1_i1.p1  ORF type:complete len:188 (-),score=49.12 TRINITY_DN12523_c0_g1_i1:92-655(-)